MGSILKTTRPNQDLDKEIKATIAEIFFPPGPPNHPPDLKTVWSTVQRQIFLVTAINLQTEWAKLEHAKTFNQVLKKY